MKLIGQLISISLLLLFSGDSVYAQASGQTTIVAFSPGCLHFMVVGLKQPRKEGQTFPLTLTFEKAGKIEVTVPIEKVGAMQGGRMGSMTHGADEQMKK